MQEESSDELFTWEQAILLLLGEEKIKQILFMAMVFEFVLCCTVAINCTRINIIFILFSYSLLAFVGESTVKLMVFCLCDRWVFLRWDARDGRVERRERIVGGGVVCCSSEGRVRDVYATQNKTH